MRSLGQKRSYIIIHETKESDGLQPTTDGLQTYQIAYSIFAQNCRPRRRRGPLGTCGICALLVLLPTKGMRLQWRSPLFLVASLLLVVRPRAPSSVLAPSSDARSY